MVLTNDNTESRRVVEQCYKKHKTTLNPIIEWTDTDIWQFIQAHKIPYCELYNEGFTRLGCIGCPMASRKQRETEFIRWPKYKAAYLRAFDKMLQRRFERGKIDGSWKIGTRPIDVFNWWMQYEVLQGQTSFFAESEWS